jgi:hypothetical protein
VPACAADVRGAHPAGGSNANSTPLTRHDDRLPTGIRAELDSFLLSLEAENLAPKTRRTARAIDHFGRFLAER